MECFKAVQLHPQLQLNLFFLLLDILTSLCHPLPGNYGCLKKHPETIASTFDQLQREASCVVLTHHGSNSGELLLTEEHCKIKPLARSIQTSATFTYIIYLFTIMVRPLLPRCRTPALCVHHSSHSDVPEHRVHHLKLTLCFASVFVKAAMDSHGIGEFLTSYVLLPFDSTSPLSSPDQGSFCALARRLAAGVRVDTDDASLFLRSSCVVKRLHPSARSIDF